jgi:hypothetical protein
MLRWLWVLGITGCAIAREDFPAEEAAARCDAQERCQRGGFYVTWEDQEQCEEFTTETVEDELANFDICTFDPAEASRCTRRIRNMDCGDVSLERWDEACDLVFDCGFAQ